MDMVAVMPIGEANASRRLLDHDMRFLAVGLHVIVVVDLSQ